MTSPFFIRCRPYGIPKLFSIRILASSPPVVLSSRPMNRFITLIALTLLATILRAPATSDTGLLLDSYAAIVNGKVITVGEVLSALQPVQANLAAKYDGVELEQKVLQEYETIRNTLIDSELILLDFETQGGTLPDRAIEDHVNTIIHERFGNDRTAFLRALAEERLTFTEWRKQMKDQLVIQIMRQREVAAKILITPLDMLQAYNARKETAYAIPERVRLRTLTLPADTQKNTKKMITRLRSGKLSFDEAVSKGAVLQDNPEFIDLSSLNETIRKAMATLPNGDISEAVEMDGTTYLLQVVERTAPHVRPLDEVSPEIEKELRRTEFDRLNRIWVDSLRSKYYIQTFTHNLFE